MSRSRRTSVILLACGVLLSCGSGDDSDARPQPTTTAVARTTTTTTTTPGSSDEDALRQLAEDWYVTLSAIFESGLSAEEATAYLTDPYLTQFRQQVATFREAGNETEISERSRQTIESVDINGDAAVVTECLVNANVLRGPDGRVLNDEVGASRVETVATRTSAGWRFSERRAVAEVEETECER